MQAVAKAWTVGAAGSGIVPGLNVRTPADRLEVTAGSGTCRLGPKAPDPVVAFTPVRIGFARSAPREGAAETPERLTVRAGTKDPGAVAARAPGMMMLTWSAIDPIAVPAATPVRATT